MLIQPIGVDLGGCWCWWWWEVGGAVSFPGEKEQNVHVHKASFHSVSAAEETIFTVSQKPSAADRNETQLFKCVL